MDTFVLDLLISFNAFFGKTIEIVRKHKNIKLETTKERKNYLVLEPNYYNTKFFREFISYRNEKNSNTND